MNAIYARQSVDRADSISIESQIEFCRYELRGADCRIYTDRGYSGKNTQRPAFAEMMRDIEQGLITRVIVYKLDRISRSILDFSNMMERFGRRGVEFVSTTEKFDTSSPMGRAMLNICIVFAQLERETIQKRVADAYFSRSRKSFYMGGRVPYGYRLVPASIAGVRTSMYEIEPEEAEQIRLIYELYARPECSCGDIIRHFRERGILKRGKPWGRTRLAEVLRSPVYVRADLSVYEFFRERGAILVNGPGDFIGTNGCYSYKGRDRPGRRGADPEGSCLVLAPHEGIVPAQLWLQCQAKCAQPQQIRPSQKAKHTWLAGKVKCGVCGYALVEKRRSRSGARYLFCSHKMDSGACAGPGTIYSDEVEELVYGQMRRKLEQFQVLRGRTGAAPSPALTALQVAMARIKEEISALMDRMAGADETLLHYISARVRELDGKKQELAARASVLAEEGASGGGITCHLSLWEELSFEDKRRAADLLIRVVHVTSGHIAIQWRL